MNEDVTSLQRQIDELRSQHNELRSQHRLHKHIVTDLTQPIGSSSTRSYIGIVNANGTKGAFFPTGWSVAKNGTGDYTITHNLGTTNYAFFGSPFNVGYTATVNTGSQGAANTTEVGTYGSASVTDAAFYFMIIVN